MILTNTNTNETINSDLTDREACFLMNGKVSTPRDKSFAESLTRALCSKRGLSDAQRFWLHKLALATKKEAPKPSATFHNIRNIFREITSATRVTFDTDHGTIVLRHAGPNSSRPGVVRVTDSAPFDERKLFGTLELNGDFITGRDFTKEVGDFLIDLNEDPARVAGECGRRVNRCCFCTKTLTHRNSIAVGYGPVCAEKHGLPHEGSHPDGD